MTVLQVTVGRSGTRIPLRLPATENDVQEILEKNLEKQYESAAVLVAGAVSPISSLHSTLCRLTDLDVRNTGILQKLNALAEKIELMNKQEQQVFDGALNAQMIPDLDRVLEIASRLDQYIFFPGITDKKDLEQFLVNTGIMEFSEDVRPYLDYVSIGAEYSAKHVGAFTADGFVVHRSSVQAEQLENAFRNPDPVFRVLLWSKAMREKNIRPYQLELPATSERLAQAKRGIDADGFAEAEIVQIEAVPPELRERLPLECPDVERLNKLAWRITDMRKVEGEFQKFLAVLDIEQPTTIPSAYELAKDLDDYTLFPHTAEEYGKASLLECYDVDEELLSEMDGFFDYDAYGKQKIEEDGARETEFGFLRRDGNPFPAEDMSRQMTQQF